MIRINKYKWVLITIIVLIFYLGFLIKQKYDIYISFKSKLRILYEQNTDYLSYINNSLVEKNTLPTEQELVNNVKKMIAEDYGMSLKEVKNYLFTAHYGIGIKKDTLNRVYYVYSFGPDYKDDKLSKTLNQYFVGKEERVVKNLEISFWEFLFAKGDIVLLIGNL